MSSISDPISRRNMLAATAAGGLLTGLAAVGIDPQHFNLQTGIGATFRIGAAAALINAVNRCRRLSAEITAADHRRPRHLFLLRRAGKVRNRSLRSRYNDEAAPQCYSAERSRFAGSICPRSLCPVLLSLPLKGPPMSTLLPEEGPPVIAPGAPESVLRPANRYRLGPLYVTLPLAKN